MFLFLLFLSAPVVTLIFAMIVGFIQGFQGGNGGNGFDDFVNSNRYSDNR